MDDEAELHSWETDGDLPWLEHSTLPWEEDDWTAELDEAESSQQDEGTPGWPEECAGPEYWLYKNQLD